MVIICRFFLAVLILLALLVIQFIPAPIIQAETTAGKWTEVPIPAAGDNGNWLLAPGSDIDYLTVAGDGTIFVSANPSGTGERLFRSSDNGCSWMPVGGVKRTINAIAVDPQNPQNVFYASGNAISISTNAGITFNDLPALPVEPAAADSIVSKILIIPRLEGTLIVVSTRDPDNGEYGKLFVRDAGQPFSTWQVPDVGNYDVITMAASPDFPRDHRLLAVTANETDTVIITAYPDIPTPALPVVIPGIVAVSACVAFPPDFSVTSSDPYFFLSIDTGAGRGGLYRVRWPLNLPGTATRMVSEATPGTLAADISALSVSDNANAPLLLVGINGKVLIGSDNALTWQEAVKPPMGQAVTGLYGTGSSFYAVTSGTESAFSTSDDGGQTWIQSGLIDTSISLNGIFDVAVSPTYADDGALYLLTRNVRDSLWLCTDKKGKHWKRIFCSSLNGGTFNRLAISPEYGKATRSVFLSGSIGDLPCFWRSQDGGQTFAILNIPQTPDAWAIYGDRVLAVAGYDGTQSTIRLSGDGGYFYSPAAAAGESPIRSIAFSHDYDRDQTIIIGNRVGKVYLSTNNGTTFKQIGQQLPVSSGLGLVGVAFDAEFSSSGKIFAATDAPATTLSPDRIFQFIVGESREWESIDKTLPTGSIMTQMQVSSQGTLYALNSKVVAAATITPTVAPAKGGIERSLSPGLSGNFETVIHGLNNGIILQGLWLSGNQLWSIDMVNTRLVTYVDTIANPVAPLSPAHQSIGLTADGISLDWQAIDGADAYRWQVSYDDEFSDIPIGLDSDCTGSSVRLPSLETGQTYFWRVRVVKPVLGPWSETYSFSVRLGNAILAPQLLSPSPGSKVSSPNPVFQWSGIEGASGYELLVSANMSFETPLIAITGQTMISETAWQPDSPLENGRTYYWKIRAVGSGTISSWSAAGAFTVEIAPTSSTPPVEIAQPLTTITETSSPPIIINNPPATGFPTGILFLLIGTGIILIGLLTGIVVILIRRRI
jgi:photosystem II stability/assembly factor-like uncharacterized protein